MKTRMLGDIEVSEVGMGCMAFSRGCGAIPDERYSIEASMERLQTGYVDLYYLHRMGGMPVEELAELEALLDTHPVHSHRGFMRQQAVFSSRGWPHGLHHVAALTCRLRLMVRVPARLSHGGCNLQYGGFRFKSGGERYQSPSHRRLR